MIRAYAMLLVAQVALGSGGIFGRFALQDMGAVSVAAWRLALVALPLLCRSAYLRWRGLQARCGQHPLLMFAGFVLALQFVCWIQSLTCLSVGTSTLLVCTAPMWNGLYEVMVLKRRLPRSFWFALAIALCGIVVIVHASPDLPARPQEAFHSGAAVGALYALGAGVSMAAYLLIMRRAAQVAQRRGQYDSVQLLTAACTYAAVLLLALSTQDPQPLPPITNVSAWAGVVGLATVTQGVGHTLQNAALGQVRASLVGFATLLEPLVASALAAHVFGETLQLQTVMGGAAVLGALGWALWVTVPRDDGA